MYIDIMYVVYTYIYNITFFDVPQYIIYIYNVSSYIHILYMSAVGGLIDVPLWGCRINKNSGTTVLILMFSMYCRRMYIYNIYNYDIYNIYMYIDDMYVVHVYNIIYFEVPQYIIYIMYHIYTLYICLPWEG